ncbi:MAG: AIPR family protein, partial [Ruminococcus sp.]|nr:AIPR family protein [Ruminococcus sp.]
PTLDGIFVPAKITVIEDRETTDDAGVKFYDTMVQKISRYANSQNKVTAADFFSNSPFHIIMERLSKRCYAPPVNGALNPTCWYYERSRKKYEQEQVKFTKAQRDKFQQRFPKKQVITKEKLAKYMFCIECKPHIVSKGGNWVMKEFGAQMEDVYRKHKESINELYFKKAVGAAIIFNTVDNIVAHAPWYQKGGPKLNIVPYTISKIVSSIPEKLTLNWNLIWQKQALQPQFVHEIEIVTKMTNDFIADNCGSMIVTEFCKKAETWEKFKAVKYEPSVDFLKSLTLNEDYNEEETYAFKEEQRNTQINTEMKIYNLGSAYWQSLYEEAAKMKLLSEKDSSLLKIAASIEKTGYFPSPAQAKAIMAIRDRLDSQGVFVSNS